MGEPPQVWDGLGPHRPEILQTLVRQLHGLAVVDRIEVFLRDDDTDYMIAVAGLPPDVIGMRIRMEGTIPGRVLESGEAAVIADRRKADETLVYDGSDALRAGVGVPIRVGDAVRGAITAYTTDSARNLGADDVDVLAEGAAVAGLAIEHAQLRVSAEATLRATVEAMGVAVSLRDQYTADHSREVVELACETGRRLLLDEPSLQDLEFAALLHDVGKLGIPDAILHKPARLDDDEWVVVRRHPLFGERLLRDIPGLERVAAIVRSEHERVDGHGYPDGLAGDDIPIESRIILTCDAYEAMTSDRPYRPAMAQDQALEELSRSAGTQLDPGTVEALTAVLAEAGSGRAPEFVAEP